MKPLQVAIAVLILALLAAGGIILLRQSKIGPKPIGQITKPSSAVKVESKMKLASSAFSDNQSIPAKYTCDGVNISPPLTISEIPENAQGLVLIVDDPDAPAGDWVHWTVFNIDPAMTEVTEGTVPTGAVEGMTDFGKTGWGGPCPPASPKSQRGEPSGTHRYQFKLYALDTTLELGSSAKKQDIGEAMQGHILDQTLLIGLYQRG